MDKRIAAGFSLLLAVSSAVAQEIGTVTIKPNQQTGIMYADLPARPDGEPVFILRKGQVVTEARIVSSGAGSTVISVPVDKAGSVQEGDRISLTAQGPEVVSLDARHPSGGGEMGMASGGMDSGGASSGASAGMARARLTPRGATVYPYPKPAVEPIPAGGALGPYGQGLAAAAPIGTPYLRSPAFAGPPIIYQPQSVTRVLVPGITPYPSNILPTSSYGYASAPFLRTDIYIDLPYGSYYWPQGYAGTVPVEPQVPIYVGAPSTAIMTDEASYNVQRYDYTTNMGEQVVATAEPTPPIMTDRLVEIPAGTPAVPAPAAGLTLPAIPAVAPEPAAPSLPSAPEPTPAPLPSLSPEPAAPSPGQPSLAPLAGVQPPPIQPPAPVATEAGSIVIDDRTPGGVILDPPTGWQPSVNVSDSYEMSSIVTSITGDPKTATFVGDIPEAGEYEVSMWWVASGTQFRSTKVPVTVFTADGPANTSVNQTTGAGQFNPVGRYKFSAGSNQKILTISTAGLEPGPTMNISVDAIKLVKVQ